MQIHREWCMPSGDTFSIKPINKLISKIFSQNGISHAVDPFVRNSPFKRLCYSNDLDPDIKADKNMDALEFLKTIQSETADLVLFDPPYSLTQVNTCYKRLGKTVDLQTTKGLYWVDIKKEISRVIKPNGIVVSCGWNSGGIGKTLGFKIEEILLVAHGDLIMIL